MGMLWVVADFIVVDDQLDSRGWKKIGGHGMSETV